MSSVNNIEALRVDRGWQRPELAKRMATSPQQIERLEKGQRKLSQDWIDRAAAAFDVEPSTIITPITAQLPAPRDEPSPRRAAPTAAVGDTVEIVALDLSLSMGPGTLIEDFVEGEPVTLDLALVQSITRTPSDRLRLVRGIGDSMEPTLRNGDRVMVDINDRHLARINGIYWVDHYGAHGIKRLRPISKDRVLIISDNPGIEDFEVDANDLRIEGRVIWYAREL